jgi:signal transduction histidine kinase
VEERSRLFTKFGRLSPAPTGGERSSGLGLYIVKSLVTAMDGEVAHAESETGGSVFTVRLPRA